MKTKHIFIPVYTILFTLSMFKILSFFDETKLDKYLILSLFFLIINIIIIVLFVIERIYTKWDDTIFKKDTKKWH